MILDQTFKWHGRQIAWRATGEGPPLVFCHGTPWSSALWAPFAAALARDFTVYLWDMPGYGASSKEPHHEVDLGVQGEAFSALLTHWDLDRPHVVAHDYGGAVSLRAHLLTRRAKQPSIGRLTRPMSGTRTNSNHTSPPSALPRGEDDTWIPADRARRLQASIRGSTLTVIPGAGHLIQLDAPVALMADLQRWLSAQITSPTAEQG